MTCIAPPIGLQGKVLGLEFQVHFTEYILFRRLRTMRRNIFCTHGLERACYPISSSRISWENKPELPLGFLGRTNLSCPMGWYGHILRFHLQELLERTNLSLRSSARSLCTIIWIKNLSRFAVNQFYAEHGHGEKNRRAVEQYSSMRE